MIIDYDKHGDHSQLHRGSKATDDIETFFVTRGMSGSTGTPSTRVSLARSAKATGR